MRKKKTFLQENLKNFPAITSIGTQTYVSEIQEIKRESEMSLDERIKTLNESFGLFGEDDVEPHLKKRKFKQEREKKPIMNVPPFLPHESPSLTPSAEKLEKDNLEMELQQIFKHDNDLFDECEENEYKSVIKEIESYKTDGKTPEQEAFPGKVQGKTKKVEKPKNELSKLKNSVWPYQLYLQKMKLRDKLTEIADKSFAKLEKVKKKFDRLFGPSEDDDEDNCDVLLGPYSPSIDLNDEVLLASCKKCTAEWIVERLMIHFKAGKIASKDLFKKLAKYLSTNILHCTQFPDALFVKLYIENYFDQVKYINSEENIT
jgi:hypothetical protein